MAWHLAWQGDLMLVTLTDVVAAADLEAMGAAVLRVETELGVTPRKLADLTAVTDWRAGFVAVERLAQRRRRLTPYAPSRTALLVGTPLQHGFARMFETLNDHPLITIQIFNDRAAALAWLAEES